MTHSPQFGDTNVPEYDFTIWTKHIGLVIPDLFSIIHQCFQDEDEWMIYNTESNYNDGITICLST